MGWKTDWLYLLIFAEVDRLWRRAWRDSEAMGTDLGSAPVALIISEYSDGHFRSAMCRGFRKRQWKYTDNEQPVLIEPDDPGISQVLEVPGHRFFPVGEVRFSITADRKSLIFEYALGPRYGCGQVFQVHGQGKRGYLHLCEDEFPQMDIDQLIAKTQKRLFVNLVSHAALVTSECLQRKQDKSSFELRFFLRSPKPELITQAWKRGSQELEPCTPEEFLALCKERSKAQLLFCFLEEGNLVYLTWAYKLQGFSLGGSGGTEAYIWTPNGWKSVSAPGCHRWIS